MMNKNYVFDFNKSSTQRNLKLWKEYLLPFTYLITLGKVVTF